MYQFQPDNIYITQWAARNPECVTRAERMMRAMGRDDMQEVDAAGLAAVIAERNWAPGERTGWFGPEIHRDFVFNAYQWDKAQLDATLAVSPALRTWSMAGHGPWSFRNDAYASKNMSTACQSAWELHSAWGCLHGCKYCHIGGVVNLMLNLEELRDHLPEMFALAPDQKLYKYDNQTDTICFEPEYGASETMVPYFAEQSDRYLMLYTKSDNVEHLLDLPHNGQTLISWSLSPQATCEQVELGAPGMHERIAAAVACQEAGYHVRLRFSPIVPLVTWRDDISAMIRAMFARLAPELITIDVLGWMRPWQMFNAMDVDAFDPRFRDEAYAAHEAGEEKPGKHFFSHGLRKEILETVIGEVQLVSPDTPVSLCNETFQMWEELGPGLGMTADNYACCCGPDSVPGCRGL